MCSLKTKNPNKNVLLRQGFEELFSEALAKENVLLRQGFEELFSEALAKENVGISKIKAPIKVLGELSSLYFGNPATITRQ